MQLHMVPTASILIYYYHDYFRINTHIWNPCDYVRNVIKTLQTGFSPSNSISPVDREIRNILEPACPNQQTRLYLGRPVVYGGERGNFPAAGERDRQGRTKDIARRATTRSLGRCTSCFQFAFAGQFYCWLVDGVSRLVVWCMVYGRVTRRIKGNVISKLLGDGSGMLWHKMGKS